MQNQSNYVPYVFSKKMPFIEWHTYLYTPPTTKTQMHAHNCIELGFCLEGSGVFYLNNTLHPYQKGDITIMMPNHPHIAKSDKDNLAKWHFVMLDVTFYNHLPHHLAKDSLLLSESSNLLYHYSKEFVKSFLEKDQYHPSNTLALGQLIVNQILALESNETPFNHTDHLALSQVIEYISDNYQSTISVEKLAQVSHTSIATLRRKFKAVFNQSPQQFLTQTRLNLALSHLEHSSMPITEIAYTTGFGSLSSFNRHFKAHYKISPRAYRGGKQHGFK